MKTATSRNASFENKHVLHVYFVFLQPIDLFRLSIQIMLRYLEGLNLCRVL